MPVGLYSKSLSFADNLDEDTIYKNPYMGFMTDANNPDLVNAYADYSNLIYTEILWDGWEPNDDNFDTTYLDSQLNGKYWDGRPESGGYKDRLADGDDYYFVIRFVMDDPDHKNAQDNSYMTIPAWLYEQTGDGVFYHKTYTRADGKIKTGYGEGYSPNYDNETLIAEHAEAIQALGDYFLDNEELGKHLAFVELGSLGHWGEYHVNRSDPALTGTFPATATRQRYVDAYSTAFHDTKFLFRRPMAERPEDSGVYNDMTGDPAQTQKLLNDLDINTYEADATYSQTGEPALTAFRPEDNIWENAPFGGEFASSFDRDDDVLKHAFNGDDYPSYGDSSLWEDDVFIGNSDQVMDIMVGNAIEGERYALDNTINMVRASHMTFIGPKIPDLSEYGREEIAEGTGEAAWKDGALEVLKNLGYRYTVTDMDIEIDEDNKGMIEVTMKNLGIAPVYYHFTPCLYIQNPGVQLKDAKRFPVDIDLRELAQGEEQSGEVHITDPSILSKGSKIWIGVENTRFNTNEIGNPEMKLALKDMEKNPDETLVELFEIP